MDFGVCAAEVFSGTFEVAFGSREGFWKMLPDEWAGEAGPCCEEPLVDGFAPCVDHWAPCAQVEVGHQVNFSVHGVDTVGEEVSWRRGW